MDIFKLHILCVGSVFLYIVNLFVRKLSNLKECLIIAIFLPLIWSVFVRSKSSNAIHVLRVIGYFLVTKKLKIAIQLFKIYWIFGKCIFMWYEYLTTASFWVKFIQNGLFIAFSIEIMWLLIPEVVMKTLEKSVFIELPMTTLA